MTTSITSLSATQSALQVNGVNAVVFDQGGIISGIGKNKLINGNPLINQRAVAGSVVLAAGAYGHDRWKAGAAGCSYTFATALNVTTITITAGTLQQVIEGLNLQSGTHALSWQGTSQARIDTGAYGPSGITGTAVGGTNQTVEFGIGTFKLAQYETGGQASYFEQRPYGLELALCQRYYQTYLFSVRAYCLDTGGVYSSKPIPVMRAVPTVSQAGGIFVNADSSTGAIAVTANAFGYRLVPTTAPGNVTADLITMNLSAEL